MTSPLRFIRTVRHLKTRQVVGQVRHRLRPMWERHGRRANPTGDAIGRCQWPADIAFLPPGPQHNRALSLTDGRYTFLNREERLGWPPCDWSAQGLPKLWQYYLHYFEWLWTLDYHQVREVILDWIARHPCSSCNVGWEPYAVSLRIMNWCAVCMGRWRSRMEADDDFQRALADSLVEQGEWLKRRTETHLLGNHLFENGAALAFAGSAFDGSIVRPWLACGLEILAKEIPEQILADGMHFERSPMYHLRTTYVLKLLRDTRHPRLMDLSQEPLERAQSALAKLTHPDGEIALFNDSAFSIYNRPSEVLEGVCAEQGCWALPDAGYFGWRDDRGAYIVCDAGPIGPDYIPGHAHGDTLSFELSLMGQRVITDSGVFDYDPGAMRRYCRSTAAHNTVEIEGEDQSEFWGAFRVARRAYPTEVRWLPSNDGFRLSAGHTGYFRLSGRPKHTRAMTWSAEGRLNVRDYVEATRDVSCTSRIHLHPICEVTRENERSVVVGFPAGRMRVTFVGEGRLELGQSWYCPEFGRQEKRGMMAFHFHGRQCEAGFDLVSF